MTPVPGGQSATRSRTWIWLQAAVSLGLVAALAFRLDYALLGTLLRRARAPYVALLLAVSLSRIVIVTLRFRVLTRLRPVPFGRLLRQYLIGSYASNFLPTASGGDIVRVFLLKDCGYTRLEAVALIALERGLGLVALVALALLGIALYDVPRDIAVTVLVLGGTVTAAGMLFAIAGPTFLERLGARFARLARPLAALAAVSRRRDILLGAIAWSVVLQAVSIAMSWLVGRALGIDVPLAAYLALVPLVWILTMLPISLGGLGVREAAFAFLFARIGATSEAGLLVSLGTYASILFPALLGAVLLLDQSVRRAVRRARG